MIKEFVNNENLPVKMYWKTIFREPNHTLISEVSTKWKLPPNVTYTELNRLCLLMNWLLLEDDKQKAYMFLCQMFVEIVELNPTLKSLTKFIAAPKHNFPTATHVVRDILHGVASKLNFDDIEYYLSYKVQDRPKSLSLLGEEVKAIFESKIDWQSLRNPNLSETQGVDFLLSKTTCNKIINYLNKNRLV